MDGLNWTEIIVAAFLLAGTLYGHWKSAQTSRDKTIEAVREENHNITQAVKDEIRGIREESQAKDEELHAEMLLMKQELMSQNELTQQTISTLSDRVERHNNVVERTYQLERKAAVVDEQIKVANHRIEDLEKEAQ